jgi:hypothetical protein
LTTMILASRPARSQRKLTPCPQALCPKTVRPPFCHRPERKQVQVATAPASPCGPTDVW